MKDYELSTAFGRLRVFDEPLLADYESELYDESESGEATVPEPTNDEIDSDLESKPEQIRESTNLWNQRILEPSGSIVLRIRPGRLQEIRKKRRGLRG